MNEPVYRIIRVTNGWILEPYNPQYGTERVKSYVFSSSKKLAKFIEKLDEDQNSTEE